MKIRFSSNKSNVAAVMSILPRYIMILKQTFFSRDVGTLIDSVKDHGAKK